MSVAGELIVATGHGPTFKDQLGAVGEGEFSGIGVEVLVDVVAAIVAAAVGFGADRPGVFHPATFVDVMDQEIAIRPAAGPDERMESSNLVKQLADVVGFGWRESAGRRPG